MWFSTSASICVCSFGSHPASVRASRARRVRVGFFISYLVFSVGNNRICRSICDEVRSNGRIRFFCSHDYGLSPQPRHGICHTIHLCSRIGSRFSSLLVQFIVILSEPFNQLYTSLDRGVVALADNRIAFIPTRDIRRAVFLRERKFFSE